MKVLFSILGLIAAILAAVLAVLPLEKIAVIPAVAAMIFGIIAWLLAKKESNKLLKFTFLITIIAIVVISYKSIFGGESEVTVDENFIEQNEKSEENAIEELEDLPELDNFEDTDSIN